MDSSRLVLMRLTYTELKWTADLPVQFGSVQFQMWWDELYECSLTEIALNRLNCLRIYNYFCPRKGVLSIVKNVSICLSVCPTVCPAYPLAYLKNHTSKPVRDYWLIRQAYRQLFAGSAVICSYRHGMFHLYLANNNCSRVISTHPLGGCLPSSHLKTASWLYTASTPLKQGNHVITGIKSILFRISVVTFEGLKLHHISNFPLGELTALPRSPAGGEGGSLPLPKNLTPALALRPPPYDLQLPHINSCMNPELLEHSDVVYSRVFHPCHLVPSFPLPRFTRPHNELFKQLRDDERLFISW